MPHELDRRAFLTLSAGASAGLALGCRANSQESKAAASSTAPWFSISLAQWSLHRAIREHGMDPLDFARAATMDYHIDAIEYVNQFYAARKGDAKLAGELKKRADDHGVKSLLIMCDGEGYLGDPDAAKRAQAVENHRYWVELAQALGCHSVRVNAYSEGAYEEQQKLAADGLRKLCELADPHGVNVIVENHGGLSSNGAWLAGVMKRVDHPRVGTLPDFGNFSLGDGKEYDRYKGVAEMLPFAKGVSAKSHEFDAAGNEVRTDYRKMLALVKTSGYRGRIGVEYEGDKHSEPEGIRLTRALLERVRGELS
ncbi:MAG: sugar phosphate isomerase/epimerase [Planctomycetota bacterium]|nr:MAG: sugar phosphate isomerase/epimerase [Planctomycetota bacterium]